MCGSRLEGSSPHPHCSTYSLCVLPILSYRLTQCLYLSPLPHVKDLASAYMHKLLHVNDLHVLLLLTSINEPNAHSLLTSHFTHTTSCALTNSILLVPSPKNY